MNPYPLTVAPADLMLNNDLDALLLAPQQQPETESYYYYGDGSAYQFGSINPTEDIVHISPPIVLGTAGMNSMNIPKDVMEPTASLFPPTAPTHSPPGLPGPSHAPSPLALVQHPNPGVTAPAHPPPFQVPTGGPMMDVAPQRGKNRWAKYGGGLGRLKDYVPEDWYPRRDIAARRVLVEWKQITQELESRNLDGPAVDLWDRYYIRTWSDYNSLPSKFLRCQEPECQGETYFFHDCSGFQKHFILHAKKRVVIKPGETKDSPSYQAKLAAACREGKALARKPRYKEMTDKYKDLAALVKAARERRHLERRRLGHT